MARIGRLASVTILPLAVAAALASAAAAQTSTPPHIVANPNNIMVNGITTLTGTGFPPNASIPLQECGQTTWIAPQDPCDSTNAITVTTSPEGTFTTPFKVQLCPRSVPPTPPVTEETCYIGEPHPTGVDTITLLGAAKITVTYP